VIFPLHRQRGPSTSRCAVWHRTPSCRLRLPDPFPAASSYGTTCVRARSPGAPRWSRRSPNSWPRAGSSWARATVPRSCARPSSSPARSRATSASSTPLASPDGGSAWRMPRRRSRGRWRPGRCSRCPSPTAGQSSRRPGHASPGSRSGSRSVFSATAARTVVSPRTPIPMLTGQHRGLVNEGGTVLGLMPHPERARRERHGRHGRPVDLPLAPRQPWSRMARFLKR